MSEYRPAKVAYLCHEFPKHTETFVYREVDRLRDSGTDVVVFAMKPPQKPDAVPDAPKKIAATRYLPPDFGLNFWIAQVSAVLRSPIKYLALLLIIMFADGERVVMPARIRVGMFLRGALAAWLLRKDSKISVLHTPGKA